jgi:hypothetical protein
MIGSSNDFTVRQLDHIVVAVGGHNHLPIQASSDAKISKLSCNCCYSRLRLISKPWGGCTKSKKYVAWNDFFPDDPSEWLDSGIERVCAVGLGIQYF